MFVKTELNLYCKIKTEKLVLHVISEILFATDVSLFTCAKCVVVFADEMQSSIRSVGTMNKIFCLWCIH